MKNRGKYYQKQIFSATVFVAGFFVIFSMSGAVKIGITAAIELCLGVLIPSLFLPLLLCSFLQAIGFVSFISRFLRLPAKYIFNISGAALSLFVMSVVSGYPVGAVLCRQMYKSGEISEYDVKRVCICSICAGPAFVLLGVGENMLHSRQMGIVLLITHILSATALLFFGRFFIKKTTIEHFAGDTNITCSFSSACVYSVEKSTRSMLLICAYAIIFSAVISVITNLEIHRSIKDITVGLCEVTNACLYFSKGANLPVIASALGFSGLSVIAQVSDSLQGICSVYRLVISRIINAVFSYVICTAVLLAYPIPLSVAATAEPIVLRVSSDTMTMSVLLICTAIVFLYSIYQRKSKRLLDFF